MLSDYKDRLILVTEDEPEVRSYLEVALRCEGYSVETVEDGEEAMRCLEAGMPVAAIFLDVMMPKRDGLEVLRALRASGRTLPVIIISGVPAPDVVVEAMQVGATDFLGKPISPDALRRVLYGIFGEPEVEAESAPAAHPPAHQEIFFGFSPAMRELQTMAMLVAQSDTPVLVRGETGSGKEILASHLHANSRRAQRALVKLNCAALPSELVESELFGHERGAFTGAFRRKPGMFETANGGTLLLDEIGDMDFKLQAKLLQVLQDQEFQRLGGSDLVRVDVRVIASTHTDLERSIAVGSFRQDLYYRLNVVSLYMPPLRERTEDIVPLANFLRQKYRTGDSPLPELAPALQEAMLTYSWPGNVRELENVIRKLAVIHDMGAIARDLMAKTAGKTRSLSTLGVSALAETAFPGISVLDQVARAKQRAEAEAILAALRTTRWNRRKAAALLQIDCKALIYKMKKLGVDEKPALRVGSGPNGSL